MEAKLEFGKKENDVLEMATWEMGHILYLLYVGQFRLWMVINPVAPPFKNELHTSIKGGSGDYEGKEWPS